jgi:hypothetical protein
MGDVTSKAFLVPRSRSGDSHLMKMVEGGELPDAEDSMLAQVGVHPMCDDAGLDADPR